ncbi:hypothetical protein P691DRAFT_361923 [Macrolepiota fuliginosa MF-IS2]|uniref:CFEM domain-containing protein n=1 Tax=Macrolepiota fuliginosa MF-IS2 TaxID=1400762 RepID=A0A9P6BYD5_9AGAR|nr:hypothetical protein P691DRAFT_361923 [Macrolepiota fuliginosa MF-IS2]
MLPVLAVLLTFLSFLSRAWAQSAIPPTSFSDVSSTPLPSTTTRAPVSSVTAPSSSVSGSLSVSNNGTQTSSAAFPSLSGYPPCVSNCLATTISSVGCTSIVDVNCFCPSDRFPLTLVNCISAACSDQISSGESLAQQFCRLSNSTITPSFPLIPATTTATSTSLTTASSSSASGTLPSSPASTSNAALGSSVLSLERGVGLGLVTALEQC